jgi:transketolase
MRSVGTRKGHGGLSLYPILADLGFFAKAELDTVLQEGSTFGSIPDCAIPGFETTNGSLGQGLGVAAGMALGLQTKRNPAKVFVVLGDGELYEGSIWEALSFAAHNKLNNLIAILDYNKISMLGYCEKNLGLEPLEQKFAAFGWQVHNVDGHAVEQVYTCLKASKQAPSEKPTMVIAHTIKGKGVKELEGNPLCHVRSLSKAEVELAIAVLDDENS